MKKSALAIALPLWLCLMAAGSAGPARAQAKGADAWTGYLDYAYVYSSAEPEALKKRLAEYGREAGMSLSDYAARRFEGPAVERAPFDEARARRAATAHLLLYLAEGDPVELEKSVEAALTLEDRLGRHENRYWYHYVLAHRALEKGQRFDFVAEVLKLWLRAVVPLEVPYETLHTLSLSEAPNSGFVSALPYLYENVARMILIRSQQMGLDRDLDPLAALVRLLYDGRVGAHPDVIPAEASSREYLERIVTRLDGPESDSGSLTFTLALFEASKYHDQARGLLASQGLDAKTVEALRVASGAYEAALNRATTEQGRCAVYTRVLRMLGEVYAAKQRLGVDPEFEVPFSIEGAIEVYSVLAEALDGGHEELGYRNVGRQAYVDAMRGLWEEIEEASLNVADYYLSRAASQRHLADEHSRDAARVHGRYLSFFLQFATPRGQEALPDSAYFAAYESARGFGDAFLGYAARDPKPAEVELAMQRYRSALMLFPFDRRIWSGLTAALGRQGRESEYMELVRPVAESVVRSRSIDSWIKQREPGFEQVEATRRALSDSLVIMHLGFADAASVDELDARLVELRARRSETEARLASLAERRAALDAAPAEALPAAPAEEAGAPLPPAPGGLDRVALHDLERQVAEAEDLLQQLDRQIAARSQALPLYRETLATDGLADQLRAQRDHPVHKLLRRMYHENRS
jgi:uncharacterized coiled-coil protein SlyX